MDKNFPSFKQHSLPRRGYDFGLPQIPFLALCCCWSNDLYYYIKENLLSLMSGCLQTPPKPEGLGQWNLDTVFTNIWGVTWVGWFWGSILRAALRLRKVSESGILRPWHPEFWSCNHEFWVFCSSYWPYEKTLLVLFDTTLRASIRLMEEFENAVLRPWHAELWSCNNEFWVFCLSYRPYEKTLLVLFDTTLRASFWLMEVLENAVLRPWHPEFWSCSHEFQVFCWTYWPYEKTVMVLFHTTLRASFRLMDVLENAVLRH